MEYTEVLRRLAINDEHVIEESAADLEFAKTRSEDPRPGPPRRTRRGRRHGALLRRGDRCRDQCRRDCAETVGVLVGVIAGGGESQRRRGGAAAGDVPRLRHRRSAGTPVRLVTPDVVVSRVMGDAPAPPTGLDRHVQAREPPATAPAPRAHTGWTRRVRSRDPLRERPADEFLGLLLAADLELHLRRVPDAAVPHHRRRVPRSRPRRGREGAVDDRSDRASRS